MSIELIAMIVCLVLAVIIAAARVVQYCPKEGKYAKYSKRLKGIRMARCCKHCKNHGVYNACPCQITISKPVDKYMVCDAWERRIYKKKPATERGPRPATFGPQSRRKAVRDDK